jgi:hypothetical protein
MADDVDQWLGGLTDELSTRSPQAIHSVLRRDIRQPQVQSTGPEQRATQSRVLPAKDQNEGHANERHLLMQDTEPVLRQASRALVIDPAGQLTRSSNREIRGRLGSPPKRWLPVWLQSGFQDQKRAPPERRNPF